MQPTKKTGYIVVAWEATGGMTSIKPDFGKAPDEVKRLVITNLLQDLNIPIMVDKPRKKSK